MSGTVNRNFIGKTIVVHAGPDDMGLGEGDQEAGSLASGNAGARIGCCVITALDNAALPDGARCNASKKEPMAARPKCAEGLCCGTAFPKTEEG